MKQFSSNGELKQDELHESFYKIECFK